MPILRKFIPASLFRYAAAGLLAWPLAIQAAPKRQPQLPPSSTDLFWGETTPIPNGWESFCERYESECAYPYEAGAVIHLDAENWEMLNAVNTEVNKTITYVPDLEQWGKETHWDIALKSKKGDCEEYVLSKRHELIAKGYPASALLITLVFYYSDKDHWLGHALLAVRTDQGVYVMDSRDPQIMPIEVSLRKMHYRLDEIQSPTNELEWVRASTKPLAPWVPPMPRERPGTEEWLKIARKLMDAVNRQPAHAATIQRPFLAPH